MKYHIEHSTIYSYSSDAALSMNLLCLNPRKTPAQEILSHQIITDPMPDYHNQSLDFFGNQRDLYAFEKPHNHLEITSHHEVEIKKVSVCPEQPAHRLQPFTFASPFVPLDKDFLEYGRECLGKGKSLESLRALTRKIYQEFEYDSRATDLSTPVKEVLLQKKGVCQDFAHLMLSVLRCHGVPSRYVSGYLNTLPPPGKEKILGADASHAWVSAYVEDCGWVDFDPTNGLVVETDHITIAWGRDYGDVTPIKGVVLGGGTQKLEVQVTVTSSGI